MTRPAEDIRTKLHGVTFYHTTPHKGSHAVIDCDTCTADEELNVDLSKKALPQLDGQLRTKSRQAGWSMRGKKFICPDCTERAKNPTEPKPKQEPAQMNTPMSKVVGSTTPSQDARRMRRTAVELLELNYDTERGRYRGKWSDAVIANETGLAETAVASLRFDMFGDGAENEQDERAVALLADLEARLQQLERDFKAEAGHIKNLIDAAVKELCQ